MVYKAIFCNIKNNIAVVMHNRLDLINAFNTQMLAEITHAARESWKISRVIALTGVGHAFC